MGEKRRKCGIIPPKAEWLACLLIQKTGFLVSPALPLLRKILNHYYSQYYYYVYYMRSVLKQKSLVSNRKKLKQK